MDKGVKRNWFLITIGFILLLNISFVLGASGANIIESVAAPIGNLDIGDTYMKYPKLFDSAFYLVFFISLCVTSLGKIEMFKNNKTTPVILGIALAISMSIVASRTGLILLKHLGFVALLILSGWLGILIYNMIQSGFDGDKVFSAAIGMTVFLILFIAFTSSSVLGSKEGTKAATSTKQYTALALFVMWPVAIVRQGKKMGLNSTIHKGPSKSEYTDGRTFFPQQTDAMDKLRGVERGLERNIIDPTETDILKTEEGLENFDQYDNALKAQAGKFTAQLKELSEKEKDTERKEAGMLTALSSYGQNIDEVLSKMNSVEVLDQAGKNYIIQNVKGIADVCVNVVNNQKELIEKRKEVVGKSFTEDISKIDDVVKKFGEIDKALIKIESNITKDMGKSILKQVSNRISAQEKRLEELMNKMNSDKYSDAQKQSMGPAVAALRTEIETKKAEATKVKSMEENIKNTAEAIHKQLKEMREILKDVNSAKDTLDKQSAKNIQFLANFDKDLNNMNLAAQQLNHSMTELAQKAELAEEVPEAAAEGVAQIFNTMIDTRPEKLGLQPQMKIFYTEDILPSIADIKKLITSGSRVDTLIDPLQKGIENVNSAYIDLKSAADHIIGGDKVDSDAETSKNIKTAMFYASKIIASEQAARTNMTNDVIRKLDQATNSITTEIQNIDVEIQKLQDSEKKVLGELSKALEIIVKNKKRVNDQFKEKADNFNQKMNQATQKISEGRIAA